MFGSRRESDDDGRVAVVGLGRFGSSVALTLVERGIEVLAVDSNPKNVQEIAEVITHAVVADSTDIEALRQTGLQDFSHVVVAIGSDIEASILTTTLLAELEVPDIWAKAVTATHGRILSRIGAHHVVLPEKEMGRRVGSMVTGAVLDYFQVDDDLAFVKCHPSGRMLSGPVDCAALDSTMGIRLVAVKRGQTHYRAPRDREELRADDVVVLCGSPDRVREVAGRR